MHFLHYEVLHTSENEFHENALINLFSSDKLKS